MSIEAAGDRESPRHPCVWEQQVDAFARAWREAWQNPTEPPRLDDYVLPSDAPARKQQLELLVAIDLEGQWVWATRLQPGPSAQTRRLESLPRLDAYVDRYPELGALAEL